MTKRIKLPKPIKAWAGVTDGKLHRWSVDNGNYYEIYPSRSAAKDHYEQVVRVKIVPVNK